MASYLCQVQTIQRGEGRSAVAAAAYRSGQGLIDDRLAMEFDFSNKTGIEGEEIILPQGAPEAFRDRQLLWNSAEAAEKRKDAVPAREILVALPHELNFEQRRRLLQEFVEKYITRLGMIADIAMHLPGAEGDQRNYHAHILLTTRSVSPSGFGAKNPAWRTPQQVRQWRAGWAEIQNDHLRRHLGPDAPQVSHLSLAERGIDRAPEEHVGPAATAMERKQQNTERGDRNRDIAMRNRSTDALRSDYARVADRLATNASQVETPIGVVLAEARRVRDDLETQRSIWNSEYNGLQIPKIPSAPTLARDLVEPAQSALKHARHQRSKTEARVARLHTKRLGLDRWIRNPGRMIWAKHAELNALARARRAVMVAETRVAIRHQWLASPAGVAWIETQRQPALTVAAATAPKKRTLVRKLKRMDRRVEAATRTVRDLETVQALGQRRLLVPNSSPDATRFIRDVGQSARDMIARYPAPARAMAVQTIGPAGGSKLGQPIVPGR